MDKTLDKTLQPLISIIMPTHNAGRFIGNAVRSVLAQSYPHWELIIVDDASTDNTEAVMRGFEDPRIVYHQSERIGHPAGVRNTALRMAQGDFIAFLDSDDLYFPDSLEKLSRPLLKNPELTAVYGFAFSMDEHENPLPQTLPLVPKASPQPGESPYDLPPGYSHSWENIATSNISCLLAALMLRRSAWETIGFFNESLCGPEDYEFYVRMYLHDYDGVLCLSDYVYKYRIHSASLTKAPEHCERLLSSCIKIMDWMFHEAPIPAHVHAYKSRAYVACYRYLARERLLHHQPALARQIAWKAFGDHNINPMDFLKACGPLLLRSFLPPSFDSMLVQLRRALRERPSISHTIPRKAAITP
jgi:glycosyltransferase involved in cell wall biosynthesis